MPSVRIIGSDALSHRIFLEHLYHHMLSRLDFGPVFLDRILPSLPLRLFTNRLFPLGTPHSREISFCRLCYNIRAARSPRCDIELFHTQQIAGGALHSREVVVVSLDTTGIQVEEMIRRRHDRWLFQLERAILNRADLVVTWSQWAADSAIRDYGVAPSKTTVVRNGVVSSEVHAHVGGGGWLFVGNDFRRKGGDILVEVHQKYFRTRPLTVVTSSAIAGKIRGENLRVMHDVPRQRLLAEIYPRADLFVFPTREDYSPWVITEALWSGLPVISTRVGAIPEMVRHGLEGWLLDRVDADLLAAALAEAQDPGLLHRAGRAARRRAEEQHALDCNLDRLCDRLAGYKDRHG